MTTENTVSTNQETPVFPGTDVPVQALFDYLDQRFSLLVFLKYHPDVTMDRAVFALTEKLRQDAQEIIHSGLPWISGTPRFVGTRVPTKNLTDYMSGGYTLDEFLDDFPSVSREQALSTIKLAGQLLESVAYENSAG